MIEKYKKNMAAFYQIPLMPWAQGSSLEVENMMKIVSFISQFQKYVNLNRLKTSAPFPFLWFSREFYSKTHIGPGTKKCLKHLQKSSDACGCVRDICENSS